MNGTDKKQYQLVKVYIRQRPFTKNELDLKCASIVQCVTSREISIRSGYNEKKYQFDQVFGEDASQLEIYSVVVSPLISYIISGYNCTVFAYGQTGTGKTHTIIGKNTPAFNTNIENDNCVGIIPRAASHLFSELSKLNPKIEYTVRISFIEIYNEEVRDLLNDCTPLRVCDDPENKGSVCMRGLSEITVCTLKEVYELLNNGAKERQTAATNLNTHSSRSHTVFTVLVNTREITSGGEELIKTGKLHLVDLAGSENIGRSGATDIRAREAGTINKSLLTLGKVIKALAQKMHYIPYRDSKLTRILQDSLGGNTKTCMIGTISPGISAWDETVSTLDYASTARNVANCPHVNVNRKQANFLKDMQDEIGKLRNELAAARSGDGFYMSQDSYQKMSQVNERNQQRVLELIRQIKDLEECKQIKEREVKELHQSFEETKAYLAKELEKKDFKVRQNEYILNYMYKREDELAKSANILLEVCETSTKHEDIYHSKYERQCNATLANAHLAKDMLTAAVRDLKEIQNTSDKHTCHQNAFISDVSKESRFLKEGHLQNLEEITNLSLEMQSEADNYDGLTLESIFGNDYTLYTENGIRTFFNNLYDKLFHLEDPNKIKQSLEDLKNYTLTKHKEMEAKYASSVDSVNDGLTNNKECYGKTKEELQNMLETISEGCDDVEDQISRSRKVAFVLEEYLSETKNKEEKLLKKLLALKQRAEELRQSIENYETKNVSSYTIVKEVVTDLINCQTESMETQLSMVESVIEDLAEKDLNLENQIVTDKATINDYLSRLLSNVSDSFSQYNTQVKNVFHNGVRKATAIKENLFKTAHTSIDNINKNADLLSCSVATYNSDMKKFIQESAKNMQNMEEKINFTTHVGDTPAKNSYSYPKNIDGRIPKSLLLEEFNSIPEESAVSESQVGTTL